MRLRRFELWMFFLPAILLGLIFYLGPLLSAFYYATTDKTLTGIKSIRYNFVGLNNFIQMFQDPRFLSATLRTLFFLFFSGIVGQQVCGFCFALLQRGKKSLLPRFMGATVLTAWIAPEVVAGFSLYAYLGNAGILNSLLGHFGTKVDWLTSIPLTSVTLANIWRGTAFSMLVYASALESIPKELEESASLAGCSRWQKIRYIILPLLRNTIVTNSILVSLQTLGAFGLIYLLTGGGPSGKSQTLPILMYEQSFIRYQVGYGTAISLSLLVLGVLLGLFYVRFEKSSLYEEK